MGLYIQSVKSPPPKRVRLFNSLCSSPRKETKEKQAMQPKHSLTASGKFKRFRVRRVTYEIKQQAQDDIEYEKKIMLNLHNQRFTPSLLLLPYLQQRCCSCCNIS